MNGKITLLSKSLTETNILAKFDPNWIIPWIGINASGGTTNDKPTNIRIPPPRLRAVDIKEQIKFRIIKKTAAYIEIVSGKRDEKSINLKD